MSGILGVSSEIHDAGISLVTPEGDILLSLGEERFTRNKKEGRYPFDALAYAQSIGLCHHDVAVPLLDREASLEAHERAGMPLRGDEPFLERIRFADREGPVIHVGHHVSHAASAYFTSGFDDALILTMDGGSMFEPWCTTLSRGSEGRVKTILEDTTCFTQNYFFATALLGFTPNKHEGKLTGLSARGEVNRKLLDFFEDHAAIEQSLVHRITTWHSLDTPERTPRMRLDQDILRSYRKRFSHISPEDVARTVQHFTEENVLEYISSNVSDIRHTRLALAGGLFANVVLNQKIQELGFKEVFIHPGMGDDGLALGAALSALGQHHGLKPFRMAHAFLGCEYSDSAIRSAIDRSGLPYETPFDIDREVAELLAQGKIVARYSGRMEYGPRALGNRSILYQTTDTAVNEWLNKRLRRTEFMPFAPATLEEHARECYRHIDGAEHTAQFMTITFDCTERMRRQSPAVVHIDGTARPQIVTATSNPCFHRILSEYHSLTGIPSLINTSFNNHGEPIVCTPQDAIQSFVRAGLDYLALGDYLVRGPVTRPGGGRP